MLPSLNQALKILLVQTGRIGDLILLLPVAEVLKKINPQLQIHFLTSRHNCDVLRHYPLADRVHVYQKGPIGILKTLYKLRSEKYDLWIDPKSHASGESRMLAMLGGAACKIGYQKSPGVFHYTLDSEEDHPHDHVVFLNLLSLRFFGITPEILRPRLYMHQSFEQAIRQHLNSIGLSEGPNPGSPNPGSPYPGSPNPGSPYLCFNLSGSRPERSWNNANWIALIEQLPENCPPIIMIASPAERERLAQIASKLPHKKVSYLYTDSITDTFGLIANAYMLISPDTSVVHIAAAYDTPIVALYLKHPHFYKYHPLSTLQKVLMDDSCQSVDNIPPEAVLEAYKELSKQIETEKHLRKSIGEIR
jgi:ADP-heptose:LPS heptosyltransferase